jgi:large subunit ribosomal protein L31
MVRSLKLSLLGEKKAKSLKLEIDPKSHAAWTGGKQKLMDKGRISKFNKKFQNFKAEKKN